MSTTPDLTGWFVPEYGCCLLEWHHFTAMMADLINRRFSRQVLHAKIDLIYSKNGKQIVEGQCMETGHFGKGETIKAVLDDLQEKIEEEQRQLAEREAASERVQ